MSEEINRPEENVQASPENNISKIKVRHVLARRIIALIVLAVVCFSGGILTDRFLLKHNTGRGFYGRPGMQRNMRGNFPNGGNWQSAPNSQSNTQPNK